MAASSAGLRTGRPYVVVSADAHAAPDTLDEFLSYVDPGHRQAVEAFGDLSSVAIPMFGGVDPGEIDDPDAVRAVAARRLAGMGVDVVAAREWLANARLRETADVDDPNSSRRFVGRFVGTG